MTAQVLEFRPRTATRGPAPLLRTKLPEPRIIPATPEWWTCPTWCGGDDDHCFGGETVQFSTDGPAVTTPRKHRGVIYTNTVHDLDGRPVDVQIEVSAVEYDDEGFIEAPAVSIDVDANAFAPDTAEEIANAILAAVAVARQPLPALSPRSPSLPSLGGGRASTPLEAS